MSGSKAFRLLVLRACRDLPPEADGFVIDRVIAEQTGVSLAEVRDCLVLLEESSEIAMVRTVDGTVKAFLEAKGRLTLHQAFPFDRATGPERVITVKQVADMIRAGQYREFVVQILTSPYFFALSLIIFVPVYGSSSTTCIRSGRPGRSRTRWSSSRWYISARRRKILTSTTRILPLLQMTRPREN